MQIYYSCLCGLLGLFFGSFLNCAAYRIVRGQDFVHGRSICPACKHTLGVLDLIPVLSFLIQRGKCRYCKTVISIRYPLSELTFAAVTVLIFINEGASLLFCRDFLFTSCLFCLSLVDWESYEIPDGCLIISVAVWLAFSPFVLPSLKEGAFHVLCGIVTGGSVLVISLILDHVLGKESMGGGDIKLLSVAGLYLGGMQVLFAVFLSCVFGLIIGRFRKKIPLAPAVSLSVCLMLMYGKRFTDWYMGLFL